MLYVIKTTKTIKAIQQNKSKMQQKQYGCFMDWILKGLATQSAYHLQCIVRQELTIITYVMKFTL